MRILQLAKFYPPHVGGLETYVGGLCDALATEHEVTVLAFNEGRRTLEERVGAVRVIRAAVAARCASQPLSFAYAIRAAWAEADLVHLHWPNPLALLLHTGLLRRLPLVVTHHADITRQRLLRRAVEPAYRRALARALSVMVLSRNNAHLSRTLGPDAGEVTVIPQALDLERLVASPAVYAAAAALRARAGAADLVIGFVGRLVTYKGVDVLLRALARLPRVVAVLAGEGPMRAAWQALAGELGVADRAHFLGHVDETEKQALYYASDVLVLPSISNAEAFGIVQAEAQLCALPVVASDLPTGVSEVTRHGETGLLFPVASPDALAAALHQLAADPGLRERLGRAGERLARATYSKDVVAKMVIDHFAAIERRLPCSLDQGRMPAAAARP